AELEALIDAGERLTVLDWARRSKGSEAIDAALTRAVDDGATVPEPIRALAKIPWRLSLTTAYPDLLARACEAAGERRPTILRDAAHGIPTGDERVVLHSSPSEDLRRDHDLFELVEEAVRTRALVLLGLELGDPDLRRILALLGMVRCGDRRPVLFWPDAGEVVIEGLRERYGVEGLPVPAGGLAELIAGLAAAAAGGRGPSTASERLPMLELGRLL